MKGFVLLYIKTAKKSRLLYGRSFQYLFYSLFRICDNFRCPTITVHETQLCDRGTAMIPFYPQEGTPKNITNYGISFFIHRSLSPYNYVNTFMKCLLQGPDYQLSDKAPPPLTPHLSSIERTRISARLECHFISFSCFVQSYNISLLNVLEI